METMLSDIKSRSEIIQKIRSFFEKRNVLSIETPLLSKAASVDFNLEAFSSQFISGSERARMFLQSSPEFHMKRFLVFYQVDCYQITKAFRNGEYGRFHNPEFSILEWYRIGVTYFELMKEMEYLSNIILGETNYIYKSYRELFQNYLDLDPCNISLKELQVHVNSFLIESIDEGLDFLFIDKIEPELKKMNRVFVYDYPASQAALAKLNPSDERVACRFELYVNGVELCNGFEELVDAEEQEKRFLDDLKKRKEAKKNLYPYDKKLITALQKGMPKCSGIAVGLDRLIMLALGKSSIRDIMLFDFKTT